MEGAVGADGFIDIGCLGSTPVSLDWDTPVEGSEVPGR